MSIVFVSPAFPSRGAGSEAAQGAIWAEGVWADCVWADGVWINDVPGCDAPPSVVYSGLFLARRRADDSVRITL